MIIVCYSCGHSQIFTSTYNPYKFTATDTVNRYYIDASDSFLIQYIHSGNYMSTLVGRMICEIDSTKMDTLCMVNGEYGETEVYWPHMKNCRADTAAYRRERHFYSHIQVYAIYNGNKTPIGKEMYGYYVESGCYEDIPKNWVIQAKNN